jgi:hypothetical protein
VKGAGTFPSCHLLIGVVAPLTTVHPLEAKSVPSSKPPAPAGSISVCAWEIFPKPNQHNTPNSQNVRFRSTEALSGKILFIIERKIKVKQIIENC